MIQGFKILSSGSNGSLVSLPFIFLAMNLLTQVVCVSGVNKLTSVRGKHDSDHPIFALIKGTSQDDLFHFHEPGSHS